jgi:hypothetical protein
MGLVEFPEPFATLLLNQNRKRGRPQINTVALIRQLSEAYRQKRIHSKLLILQEEAILILNIFFCNRTVKTM